MELLIFLLLIALSGLIVGGLARLAVPGPDPMPWWQTILLGVTGSAVGGVIAAALGMSEADEAGNAAGGFLLSLAGATALLILYRKLVQRRPITGPGSRRRS